ncbi:MAG: hypothetical protein SFU98_02235 [Leptospiraceae bacterium]|nr:hypothetical protein [Leptospiraceae bacterium]
MILKKSSLYLTLVLVAYCATSYQDRMKTVEEALYSKRYDAAVPEIRNLVVDSSSRDKLLYLMEAGIVLHTKKDFEASNKAFGDAEALIDTSSTSVTNSALSFVLSDNESDFKGESFERVLIKFYMALNYLCLNKFEDAKRYFKKVSFEQKEMKVTDAKYKQNLLARYLDAIASENLGKFNDARVEYKNLMEIDVSNKEFLGDRYVLAVKEKDATDQAKFAEGKNYISAFDKSLNKTSYATTMGELIIVNQAGKSAVKESRGKLLDDPTFATALKGAVEVGLRSQSNAGLSLSGVMASLSFAENPIPIYKEREKEKSQEIEILLNQTPVGRTKILNDYSAVAMNNFNENYNSIIAKNVTSIAAKVIASAALSYAAAESLSGDKKNSQKDLASAVLNLIFGLISGAATASTLSPDLRCWRTSPSNFQAKRIFLEAGEYELNFKSQSGETPEPILIKIESGKPSFVTFRSL